MAPTTTITPVHAWQATIEFLDAALGYLSSDDVGGLINDMSVSAVESNGVPVVGDQRFWQIWTDIGASLGYGSEMSAREAYHLAACFLTHFTSFTSDERLHDLTGLMIDSLQADRVLARWQDWLQALDHVT